MCISVLLYLCICVFEIRDGPMEEHGWLGWPWDEAAQLYLCICVFVYLCICVLVYLCISVFVYFCILQLGVT